MIRRSEKHAMVGGVCAGYAISERKPVALVRLFVVLLMMATAGTTLLLYFAAWIIMPSPDTAPKDWDHLPVEDKFVRSDKNQVLGGVCGAIAKYFKIDATMVRAVTAVLALVFGLGVFAYIFAWAIIPEVHESKV